MQPLTARANTYRFWGQHGAVLSGVLGPHGTGVAMGAALAALQTRADTLSAKGVWTQPLSPESKFFHPSFRWRRAAELRECLAV